MNLILSLVFAAYFFTQCAIFFPVAALLALVSPLFDKKKVLLNRVTAAYTYRALTVVNPCWKFTFEGFENIDPNEKYIFVANHQSFADILVLSRVPHPFRWVSKAEVFQIPFLGWIMGVNGDVPLKRGSMRSTRRMLHKCSRLLKQGISVFMFPEGHRSKDGTVGTFNEGAFRLAHRHGVKVVPVAVIGTGTLLAKGSWEIDFGAPVRVHVLPPIAIEDCDNSSSLCERVRQMIVNEVMGDSETAEVEPDAYPLAS